MFIGLRALVAKSIGTRLIRLGPASSILTDTAVKVDTGNAVSRETHLRKKKKKKVTHEMPWITQHTQLSLDDGV